MDFIWLNLVQYKLYQQINLYKFQQELYQTFGWESFFSGVALLHFHASLISFLVQYPIQYMQPNTRQKKNMILKKN